jgi:hypothetical protein
MLDVVFIALVVSIGHPFPVFAMSFAMGLKCVLIEMHPADRYRLEGNAAENERVRIPRRNQATVTTRFTVVNRERSRRVLDRGETACIRIDIFFRQPINYGNASLTLRDVAEIEQRLSLFRLISKSLSGEAKPQARLPDSQA